MLDFLSDILSWIFEDFFLKLFTLIMIIVLSLLLWLCGYLIYENFKKRDYTNCQSISKSFVPGHSMYIMVGKVMSPVWIGDSYQVNQMCTEGSRSIEIDRSMWKALNLQEN